MLASVYPRTLYLSRHLFLANLFRALQPAVEKKKYIYPRILIHINPKVLLTHSAARGGTSVAYASTKKRKADTEV